MKVLLVDDDLELLNSLTQKLIGLGLEVEGSDNLERAKNLFQQDPTGTNLLVTEIIFQEGDGFALLRWMRRKNPNILAIVITNQADLRSAITAIKLGVTDFLEKPISMKELQNAVIKCHKLVKGLPAGMVHIDAPSGKKTSIKAWRPKWHSDLVELMNESVKYWQYSTGTNKGELAKRSGIWSIQVDRNTLRARTLDRYTMLETLPQHPHWDKVLETARYVLRHCPPSSQRFEIEVLLYRLQRMMTTEERAFLRTPPAPSIPGEPEEMIAPVSGPSQSIPTEP